MMKLNPKMKVREVAGEHIAMRVGGDGTDLTTVIALNESSMLLYNHLKERPFTADDAVAVLLDNYDVDEATARHDVEEWVQAMRRNMMLADE